MSLVKYAPRVYDALNGVFCIYKPAGVSSRVVQHNIKLKLAQELNSLPCRPPRQIVKIHEENIGTDQPIVSTVPDIADDPLVVGPRYLSDDLYVNGVSHLKMDASGVTVYGIGLVSHILKKILNANFIRVYRLKGEFGSATQDFTPKGHLILKTTWEHITRGKLDRVTAAIQSGHQRHMFEYTGVDIQSQEAYSLTTQGLIRPAYSPSQKIPPLIYSIKCVHFEPPNFELEVHTVNERDEYLRKIVHEIGIELHSSAVCTQVRRIQYGPFTLDHSLLQKHWTAENIITNISTCKPLVTARMLRPPRTVTTTERKLEKLPPGGQEEMLHGV